jgi:hypothetical protein
MCINLGKMKNQFVKKICTVIVTGCMFTIWMGCEKPHAIPVPDAVVTENRGMDQRTGNLNGDMERVETDQLGLRIYRDVAPFPIEKPKWPKVVFSFTFGGFKSCSGGEFCGSCPGICIQFATMYTAEPLKDNERASGLGLADIMVSGSGTKLHVRFNAVADNGDGYTRIMKYYDLGSDIARKWGFRRIMILPGAYRIFYSEKSPMGDVLFNVRTS